MIVTYTIPYLEGIREFTVTEGESEDTVMLSSEYYAAELQKGEALDLARALYMITGLGDPEF